MLGVCCCALKRCVLWRQPDVSEEHIASIFMAEAELEISRRRLAACPHQSIQSPSAVHPGKCWDSTSNQATSEHLQNSVARLLTFVIYISLHSINIRIPSQPYVLSDEALRLACHYDLLRIKHTYSQTQTVSLTWYTFQISSSKYTVILTEYV
jgi:hypothetical protein